MALTKEDLQAIGELLDAKLTPIQKDISNLKKDVSSLKEDVEELKDSMEEVRDSTNYLAGWVDKLDTAFKQHEITGKG